MNVKSYLERIKFSGPIKNDLDTLAELHKKHLTHIPFENLDIHQKRTIKLDFSHIFTKIIRNNRGGFCYELNFLFYELLRYLNFNPRIIAAKVFNQDHKPGPDFDHMALVLDLEGLWLIDVGFGGNLFTKPLKVEPGIEQNDHFQTFMIEKYNEQYYVLLKSENDSEFKEIYIFDLIERKLKDFQYQCTLKQTSAQSHFVKNKMCTIITANGRKTLLNSNFIVKSNNTKKEIAIKTHAQEQQILDKEFNIKLG